MDSLVPCGRDEISERDLFMLAVPDLASLETVSFPAPHFTVFLAFDGILADVWDIARMAELLIASGCVYFCAWGSDCERVHDIFDQTCPPEMPVIMTTWHTDDSLDEALRFFLRLAWPDDAYIDTCHSALVISVGNSEWSSQIAIRLRDNHLI